MLLGALHPLRVIHIVSRVLQALSSVCFDIEQAGLQDAVVEGQQACLARNIERHDLNLGPVFLKVHQASRKFAADRGVNSMVWD